MGNLDVTDLGAPVSEIRKYLCARYDRRFSIHPRKFEEVVSSVFRDLGYDSRLTAYSKDGGIDVLLSGPHNEQIGVQVMRHRGAITVERIRAFMGALIVNECVAGVFVTTSTFQSGARNLARACENLQPIELTDANRFLEELKIAQLNSFEANYPFDEFETPPKLCAVGSFYLNSL